MANRDLVAFEGPSLANGEGMVDLLRIIGADGRERETSFDLEKGFKEFEGGEMSTEVVGRVSKEDNKSVLGSWMNGDFVKLCRCLGVPTEGFEGEIFIVIENNGRAKKI